MRGGFIRGLRRGWVNHHLIGKCAARVQYNVVFDITSSGNRSWSSAAFGLIFVAAGAVLVAFAVWRKTLPYSRWWSKRPTASRVFAFTYLSFAVVWTACAFRSSCHEYSTLITALKNGHVQVVQGLVTDFQPMPAAGHSMEQFCVSGACFKYSDYVVTSGFNNTSSHGGPIRQGLPVRVTYVGNSILKLEVAQ